jgi:hypothetical protein
VATQAPISVAEAETSIVALRDSLVDAASHNRADVARTLRDLHRVLLRVTPSSSSAPISCLQLAASALDPLAEEFIDALPPRQRTVFRLLRAGSLPAAWEVLADNATGVVSEPFDASTATGAARTAWRLPLLTRIERGTVYAELPGFRDPRYDAPDDCYDITTAVGLKLHLDEINLTGDVIGLGGWAALDVLSASPEEHVTVFAARQGEEEIAVPARRVRRPDLVNGTGDGLSRRAWAGWSAHLDLADPRLAPGAWGLSVQVDHHGVVRRSPVGRQVSDLARAAAAASTRAGGRVVAWDTNGRRWKLLIDHERG